MVEEKSPSRLPPAILPPLFLVLNIFLFLPVAVYQGNVEEFTVSLKSILLQLAVPAGVVLAVFSALGLALRPGGRRRLASILFAAAVLVWIQGNLLVWRYGVFSGKDIEWHKFVSAGWIDSVVWAAGLALAVFLWKPLSRVAVFGSVVFIALQAASGLYTGLGNPAAWKAYAKAEQARVPPPGIFAFSAGRNFIQIVLDGFQSDFFKDIYARDPARYGKALDGFTWFDEALGSFPSTQMSVPAYMSGRVYRNQMPTRAFIQRVNRGPTIGNILQDQGFDVDLVVGGVFSAFAGRTFSYQIDVPYGVSNAQYNLVNGARMLDLALFRGSPQPVKRLLFNRQQWVFRRLFGKEIGKLEFALFSHRAFVDDMIAKMTVSRDKPVYKYLHLMTMHPPILVDAEGRFIPGSPLTRENRAAQARYAFEQILALLDGFKSAGIYDSSLIVLQADHGSDAGIDLLNDDGNWVQDGLPYDPSMIASLALPMLAVKPPNSRGPLRESSAPVSLTDIPATAMALLGLSPLRTGRNVFDVAPGEKRERRFIYYNWSKTNWENEYFEDLTEFVVAGNPRDWNSWRLSGFLKPPEVSYETDVIEFGSRQSNRFKRSGWAPNEKDPVDGVVVNWAQGRSASIIAGLPADKPVTMTALLKSYPFKNPQKITIKVDRRVVGRWTLDAPWELCERSLEIPPRAGRPGKSLIEFEFTESLDASSTLGARAVQFRKISFR